MATKHDSDNRRPTQRPWRREGRNILGYDGTHVCQQASEEDAELIVRAENALPLLLNAIKVCVGVIQSNYHGSRTEDEAINRAHAAVRAAELPKW
jgi:hypothetical protein